MFLFCSFHSDDAFCALLPEVKAQSGGTVQQQHRKLKQQVVNYSIEQAAPNGSATEAEAWIKSLKFSSYEENNLCDLFGISVPVLASIFLCLSRLLLIVLWEL